MRFSVAVPWLASIVALASAADIDIVLAALSKTNTDLTTLNTDVNKISGGIFSISEQLQASVDTVVVDNDIIAATAAVNAAAKFNAADSQRILTAVNTLVSGSNTTITSTINKAPAFAGLSPVVLSALYQFQTDSNNLGFAFATKLDNSAINAGVQALIALQNQFKTAIDIYVQASQPL